MSDDSDKTEAKFWIMFLLLCILAGFLFGGEPDVVDAIRTYIFNAANK